MATQPAPAALVANSFQLHGHGLTISYDASSTGGRPLFHYQDGQVDQNFTGDAVQVDKSGIGTLVTVTTRKSVDADFTTFTLLVPDIHLGGKEAHFGTLGITTVHHFLAANPNLITGPLETYHAYQLQGVASFVEF